MKLVDRFLSQELFKSAGPGHAGSTLGDLLERDSALRLIYKPFNARRLMSALADLQC
jgi:hypothetical protein